MATTKHEPYLFVSYARPDVRVVQPIVQALREECELRRIPVRVWVDMDELQPGQQWVVELERVLRESVGILVFVSKAAMKSEWIQHELLAAERDDRLIIPIILEHVPELPSPLAMRQWIDLSRHRTASTIRDAAREIADVTDRYLRSGQARVTISPEEAPIRAVAIADELRGARGPSTPEAKAPASVFVVHGHDDATLEQVVSYVSALGITPIVLSRQSGRDQSLFQKFLRMSSEARFAVVVFTADDFGASRMQYEAEDVGAKALQFRARQNVILELGFFYGYLGWENVFVVFRKPNRVYPNFERPSDLDGVMFDLIDETGQWREILRARLTEAGFAMIGDGAA